MENGTLYCIPQDFRQNAKCFKQIALVALDKVGPSGTGGVQARVQARVQGALPGG